MLNQLLRGLRSRLVALAVLAILPGLILTLLLADQQLKVALRNVTQQNLSVLRLVAMSQSQMVISTKTLLTTLATSPAIRNHDMDACNILLNSALASSATYRALSVSGVDGQVWCRAPATTVAINLAQNELFTRALERKNFVMGGVQIGIVSKRPNLTFAYPVVDGSGKVVSVISAGVDLDHLNTSIDALGLPSGYVVDILDDDGTFAVRWPYSENYVGVNYGDKPITQRIVTEGKSGNEVAAEMDGVEGVRRLYAFKAVEGTPNHDLYVNVGIAPELAYADLNANLGQIVFAFAVFSILTAVVAWLVGGTMVIFPIQAIARAANRIAQGDLTARTQLPSGQDELKMLAHNFDEMAATLEKQTKDLAQANASLEERVRYRTEQLQVMLGKLRESRQQLRDLSAQQRQKLEEEQTRLSREVHDQIGQALTGLKMDLASIERRLDGMLDGKNPAPLKSKITSMETLIDNTIKTTRAIARRLRPSLLDDLGLGAAIDWYAQDFQERTGITCTVLNRDEGQPLNSEVATAAYRIFQEAMTNVVRHANASTVQIELWRERSPSANLIASSSDGRGEPTQALYLAVRDNGKGLLPEQLENARSLGVLGMRERAIELRGTVEFDSQPGRGTKMTACLPLGPIVKAAA